MMVCNIKKFRRFIAGFLMLCLMMPSFAGVAWADVGTEEYTGTTRDCLIEMDLEALQMGIQYAVSHNVQWKSTDFQFDSGDPELQKRYEDLFSAERDMGPVYYVDYQFAEGVFPAGTGAFVFVREGRQKRDHDRIEDDPVTDSPNAPMAASPVNAEEITGSEPSETAETELSETTESELSETAETEPAGTTETELSETAGTELSETAGTELSETAVSEPSETTGTELSETAESGDEGTAETATRQETPEETEIQEPTEHDATETAAVSDENDYSKATDFNAGKLDIKDYEITGNEEIILFFQNKTMDDYIFQIRIGGRQTRKIYVPSAAVLIEDVKAVTKAPESLNEPHGAGGAQGTGGDGLQVDTDQVKDTGSESQDIENDTQDSSNISESTEYHPQEPSEDIQEPNADSQDQVGDKQDQAESNQNSAGDNQAQAEDDQNHEGDDQAQAGDNQDHDGDDQAHDVQVQAEYNQALVYSNHTHVGDNEEQSAEPQVSLSRHRSFRLSSPVAGEINDEEFDERPGADTEDDGVWSDDYVENTDRNEEFGTVLEALLYQDKSRMRLFGSKKGTSCASITFLLNEVQGGSAIRDFSFNLFRYGSAVQENNDYSWRNTPYYQYFDRFNHTVDTDYMFHKDEDKGNGGENQFLLNGNAYGKDTNSQRGLVQGLVSDSYVNDRIAYEADLGGIKSLFPDRSQGSLVQAGSGLIEEAYYNVDATKFFTAAPSRDGSYLIYTFDSDKTNARRKTNIGTYELSSESWYGTGFWPFNTVKERLNRDQINYYYGMQYSTEFTLPPNKRHGNGDEIVFTFSGNDDIWVYLNDGTKSKLALDMGGIHNDMKGTINLTTGLITYSESEGKNLTDSKLENVSSKDGNHIYWYLYDAASLELTSDAELGIDKTWIEKTVGLSPVGYQEYTMDYYMIKRSNTDSSIMIQHSAPRENTENGTLTIKKELDSNGAVLPEGTEFTYDVQITNISDTAEVVLGNTVISHEGGAISTTVSVAPGESKTFAGLSPGSRYTVTQTGGSVPENLEDISMKGGDGEIHRESQTVSGEITGTLTGNIQWNGNGWYDETGEYVDIDAQLGNNFLWNNEDLTQIKTADLLRRLEAASNVGKIIFNTAGGGIDVYMNEIEFPYDSYNKTWYHVYREFTGRNGIYTQQAQNCYSEEEVKHLLGDNFIGWKEGPEGQRAARSYRMCWEVEPVNLIGPINLNITQKVLITYSGTMNKPTATLVIKKLLVDSPEDLTALSDDENQTFLYELENAEESSAHYGEKFYATITVEKGRTEAVCTVADIPVSSQYNIRELENMRYKSVGENIRTVNIQDAPAEIVFTGYKAYTGYFSAANVIQNKVGSGTAGDFSFTTHYPNGQPIKVELNLTPPPAMLPDNLKDSWNDYTRADLPLV